MPVGRAFALLRPLYNLSFSTFVVLILEQPPLFSSFSAASSLLLLVSGTFVACLPLLVEQCLSNCVFGLFEKEITESESLFLSCVSGSSEILRDSLLNIETGRPIPESLTVSVVCFLGDLHYTLKTAI